jgi:PAS domain S-box-containing protein
VRAIGGHLGADRCCFVTADAGQGTARIERDWSRLPEDAPLAGVYPLSQSDTPGPWHRAFAAPTALAGFPEEALPPGAAAQCARLGIASWAIAPFSRDSRWVAGLAVTTRTRRAWSPSDLNLLENVIARVWPLIERARSEQAVAAAETKIRSSEERLRTAIEAAQLGTWDINPKTGELVWDARARELFGNFPHERAPYQAAIDAIHVEDRPRIAEAVARAFDPASGGRYDEEYRVVGRDGQLRWLRASGRVAFENGEAVRFTGTMLDVTHLALARETLAERRDELERLVAERTMALRDTVAELEGFSYSISHDLRAPLRAMQSFAQLLAEECSDQISAEGRDYLRRIVTASNRMDRLIHDVLVYSQVSRTELQLAPIDLQSVVTGIIESYPQFQPATADIIVAPDLPRVLGNEAAITQCVSNLLGNAVKFVAPGTRPRVEVTGERKGDRVLLCVQDNGIGIDPAAHDKIFGIFERLGRQYEGTGIGLAVVRKAAERMGGSISVTSTPGRGSTFCLDLPAAP